MTWLSRPEVLEDLAACLSYPSDGQADAARRAARAVSPESPVLGRALASLADFLDATPRWEAEELYTRLFDLDARVSLHVGWHLFGENYERGALLVGLAGELEAAGVDPGTELPDHLTVVLRLLARLPEGEGRQLLVEAIVAPALEAMRREVARSDAPWAAVLSALAVDLNLDEKEALHA